MGLLVLLAEAAVVIVVAVTAGLVWRLNRPPRQTYGWALGRGLPTDPAELGLSFEERSLLLVDGTETPAWIVEGHCAGGPTVIVSHGFGDSRYRMLEHLDVIAARARQVVVYDLRAHGEAESRLCHWGGKEVRDLLTIVDQTAAGRPVVLWGYSMGAGVSYLAAALDDQDRIAGVIADGIGRHRLEPIAGHLRQHRYPVQPFLALATAYCVLSGTWSRPLGLLPVAKDVRCPVLMLHGDADPLCPLESTRQLAGATVDCDLVVIAGGGHLDLIEVDRDRYIQAVDRFLARLGSSTCTPHPQVAP